MSDWVTEYRLGLTVDEYLDVVFKAIKARIKESGVEHPGDIHCEILTASEYFEQFLEHVSKAKKDRDLPF